MEYLKQDRATQAPKCTLKAIRVVRGDGYRPAIDVLFKYLDFTPLPPGVPPEMNASPPTNGVYPAADALFQFGETVLPRIKQVIRNNNESTLTRFNAARIYFGLKPGPDAIRFIVNAANNADDSEAATGLLQFAEEAVPYCSEQQREECKLAVSQ